MSHRDSLRAYMSGPEHERFMRIGGMRSDMQGAPCLSRHPFRWLRHRLAAMKEKREIGRIIDGFEKREKSDEDSIKAGPRSGKVMRWEDADPAAKWPSGEESAPDGRETETEAYPTREDMRVMAAATRRLLGGRKPSMLTQDDMGGILVHIRSEKPEERAAALLIIAARREDKHLDAAFSMIEDESMQVMASAFFAISRIGGTKSVKGLFRLLKDEDDLLWPVAATVSRIRRSGDEGASDVLAGIESVMGEGWFVKEMESDSIVFRRLIDAMDKMLSNGADAMILQEIDHQKKEKRIPWWLLIPSLRGYGTIPQRLDPGSWGSMFSQMALPGISGAIRMMSESFYREARMLSRMAKGRASDGGAKETPGMHGVPFGLLRDVPEGRRESVARAYIERQEKQRRKLLLKRLRRRERRMIEGLAGKRIRDMTADELAYLLEEIKMETAVEESPSGPKKASGPGKRRLMYCPSCGKPNMVGPGKENCANRSCGRQLYSGRKP